MNTSGFSVTCKVTLKCYVTAETEVLVTMLGPLGGLLGIEQRSKPTLSLMPYFSLSIKDMNLLVRLV